MENKLQNACMVAATLMALAITACAVKIVFEPPAQEQAVQEQVQTEYKKDTGYKNNYKNKRKFNAVSYTYGQTYKAYLESGGEEHFAFEFKHAQKNKGIFNWMKKKGYIKDFQITGNTVAITGFNSKNMIYQKYCAKIEQSTLEDKATEKLVYSD